MIKYGYDYWNFGVRLCCVCVDDVLELVFYFYLFFNEY